VILVTGATGFVGHHVVPALVLAGMPVRCLVRDPGAPRARQLAARGAELARGDVTDEASVARAAEGAAAIVHLVAVIREKGRATFPEINYRGTLHVLDAARGARVARVVHLSALGADPAAPYPYLRSKGLAAEAVRQSGLAYTILRPSVIFGEGDAFVRLLAALVKALPAVPIVGSGKAELQPIWVGDVASAVVRALEDDATVGQSYDLGGPGRLAYEQIVDLLIASLGVRRIKVHLPVRLVRPVASLLDRVLPVPPVTPGLLSLLAVPNVTEHSATETLAGRPPRPLDGNVGYVSALTWTQAARAVAGLGLPDT
jgi:uncharacterized protein YbjT (DUF2867 family)